MCEKSGEWFKGDSIFLVRLLNVLLSASFSDHEIQKNLMQLDLVE